MSSLALVSVFRKHRRLTSFSVAVMSRRSICARKEEINAPSVLWAAGSKRFRSGCGTLGGAGVEGDGLLGGDAGVSPLPTLKG